MYYDELEYWSNTNQELYEKANSYHSPDIYELAALSKRADMQTFTVEDIKNHLVGYAMVPRIANGHAQYTWIAAYAGIPNVTCLDGSNLAEIGSVITHYNSRNHGCAEWIVREVIDNSSSLRAQERLGHEGFMAKCNAKTINLFTKLGFEKSHTEDDGKQVMTKLIQ